MIRTVAALAAAAALVAVFWWQGERFLAANGPTFDEAVHLAAGYSYWVTGDFRLNHEDPPLLKLLWTLPLVLGDRPPYPHAVAAEPDSSHWTIGPALMYDSGVPHTRLLAPARRVNLAVGCGVVLLAGWWAFRVWGSRLAGVAAAGFASFDPNLLALSCVLSTDVGLTFFALLSAYLLWEYTAHPSRGLLLASGVSLGLLLGAKFSALAVLAGFGAAAALIVVRGGTLALPGAPPGNRAKAAVDLGFRLAVIGAVVLAATYGFLHFRHWGAGLQFQLTRKEFGNGAYYLCGAVSDSGWYHYFLVALAVKLPLGLIAAAGAGAVLLAGDRRDPAVPGRSAWLWVPPLVFLAAASYSRVDLGVRVVLPAVAFLYVIAARLAAPGCCACVRRVVLAGCLAWAGVSSYHAGPHQIAYFNELAGGPVGGLRYVADSNVDWGQDLPLLKAYMDREGLDVVYLSYFGTDRPEAHGIRRQYLPGYGQFTAPPDTVPADAPRHVVAVSANNLLGIYLKVPPDTFAWLRDRPPAAILGGSIYVYDLTGDPDAIRRVRETPVR